MENIDANTPEPVETEEQELAPEQAPEENEVEEQTDGEDENAEQEEPEIEYQEVEFNGKLYKLPKEVAPHLMMQGDYTRKTQEVAEMRRQAEARWAEVQRNEQLNRAVFDDVAQLRWVEQRLQSYSGVDWNQVPPEEQQRYLIDQMQLREAKENLSQRIGQKQAEIAHQQERHTANALNAAIAELQKPDEKFGWPGKFDQKVSQELTEFGLSVGFTLEELKGTNHPLMIKGLWLMKQASENLQKQRAAMKPQAPAPKPVPMVGKGKTKSDTIPSDKDDVNTWLAKRNKQLARNNSR